MEIENSADLIAVTLRHARTQAGLSLRELAKRAHTSHATLSAYEHRSKVPSTDVFFRILEAAGFAIDLKLSPRIRERDGIARGDELYDVLKLASQFPAKPARHLKYPPLNKLLGSR